MNSTTLFFSKAVKDAPNRNGRTGCGTLPSSIKLNIDASAVTIALSTSISRRMSHFFKMLRFMDYFLPESYRYTDIATFVSSRHNVTHLRINTNISATHQSSLREPFDGETTSWPEWRRPTLRACPLSTNGRVLATSSTGYSSGSQERRNVGSRAESICY